MLGRSKPQVGQGLSTQDVTNALDASTDLRSLVIEVLKLIAQVTTLQHATFKLVDPSTGEFWIEEGPMLSTAQRRRGRYQPGEGISSRVFATRSTVIVPNVTDDPGYIDRAGLRDPESSEPVSYVCAPVTVDGQVIGTIGAESGREPPETDVRVVELVARLVAHALETRRRAGAERARLMEENRSLRTALGESIQPTDLVGNDRTMRGVYETVGRVAASDVTVLLRGESGTGKELVARAIHYGSLRAAGPLIKVSCAALPESMLESELFGHERGAFTGALEARQGRFEMAQGGTIFLDEIGECSPAIQVKLLRVLQELEFERVGGSKTIRADVRIIAATNADLEAMIAAGTFREDLYYRLNVFDVVIPPLRDRGADVMLLADHFVVKYGARAPVPVKRISTQAIDMLMAYHWPGNVRELENCIQRAVLLSSDGVIRAPHLPPSLQTAEASGTVSHAHLEDALAALERDMLVDALKTAQGNRAEAARQLGISERIMGLRVKKHGLDSRRFRGRDADE